MLAKLKMYFPIFYVIFLVLLFFYVRHVLDKKLIDVKTINDKNESAIKIKEAAVSLEIYDGSKLLNGYYKIKLNNQTSIDNLFTHLMKGEDFVYEKTEYTYGTEFNMVNNISASKGYRWILYDGTADITSKTQNVLLKKDTTYKFILTKI